MVTNITTKAELLASIGEEPSNITNIPCVPVSSIPLSHPNFSTDTGVIVFRKKKIQNSKDVDDSYLKKDGDTSLLNPDISISRSVTGHSLDKTNDSDTKKKSTSPKSKSDIGWEEVGAANSGKRSSKLNGVNMVLDIVDRSGMWRNCAGFFGLMIFTFITSQLGFGFFGLVISLTFGVQWYSNSITRFTRNARDDITRGLEKNKLVTEGESAGWINEFLSRFWLIYEPVLSATVVDIATGILDQQTPSFLNSLKLSTFTLGSKAPRVESILTHTGVQDLDTIVMDWETSFTPNDIFDMPRALIASKVNPKIVLEVRVGTSIIGAALPILVENIVFKGRMQIRLYLTQQFPHVKKADVSFITKPDIDFALKPVGGNTFGFDIAHIPGLREFIMSIVHGAMGPMLYAPNYFTIDLDSIINGSVAQIPSAVGIIIFNIQSARNIPKSDTFGKADPYVKIFNRAEPEKGIKSNRREDTLSPVWNETYVFLLPNITDPICIEVWDWNAVGKDDFIGNAELDPSIVIENENHGDLIISLFNNNKGTGELSINAMYYPVEVKPSDKRAALKSITGAIAAEAKSGDDEIAKILAENSASGDSKMAKDDKTPSTPAPSTPELDEDLDDESVESNSGLLQLYVRAARDLAPDSVQGRKMNVSAIAYLNRSPVIVCPTYKKSDSPVWELGKELFVADQMGSTVTIVLSNNDRRIGVASFNLADMIEARKVSDPNKDVGTDWVNIPNLSKGQVRVEVKWRPIIMDAQALSSVVKSRKLVNPPIGLVKVNVLEGKQLRATDGAQNNSLNPYVNLSSSGKVLGRTHYIDTTCNPTWNEAIIFPVTSINQKILIECLSKTQNSFKTIGDSYLTVRDLLGEKISSSEDDLSYKKLAPKVTLSDIKLRSGKIKGQLSYKATLIPVINFDKYDADDRNPQPSTSLSPPPGISFPTDQDNSNTENSLIQSPTPVNQSTQPSNQNSPPTSPTNESNANSLVPKPREDKKFSKFPILPDIDYSGYTSGVLSFSITSLQGLQQDYPGVSVTITLDDFTDLPVGNTSISRRNGPNHEWSEEFFQCAVPEISLNKISFKVTAIVPGRPDAVLVGKVEKTILELIKEGVVNTYKPESLELNSGLGNLIVRLRFDPTENMKLAPEESLSNTGKLNIQVVSASKIPGVDSSGTSDPYYFIIINGVKLYKSEVKKKSLTPTWSEKNTIKLINRKSMSLTIDFFDWNQVQSDERLGSVNIPLSDLQPNVLVEKDYPFFGSKDSPDSPSARIKLLFSPSYISQDIKDNSLCIVFAGHSVNSQIKIMRMGSNIAGSLVSSGTKIVGTGASLVAGGATAVAGGGAKLVAGGATSGVKLVGGGAKFVGDGALALGSGAINMVGGVFGLKKKENKEHKEHKEKKEHKEHKGLRDLKNIGFSRDHTPKNLVSSVTTLDGMDTQSIEASEGLNDNTGNNLPTPSFVGSSDIPTSRKVSNPNSKESDLHSHASANDQNSDSRRKLHMFGDRRSKGSPESTASMSLRPLQEESFSTSGNLVVTVMDFELAVKEKACFVSLSMNMKQIYKSKVSKKGVDHTFNEEFLIPILSGSRPVLDVSLMEFVRFGENKTLCSEQLDIHSILKSGLAETLGNSASVKRTVESDKGRLNISLEFNKNSIMGQMSGSNDNSSLLDSSSFLGDLENNSRNGAGSIGNSSGRRTSTNSITRSLLKFRK
ncbi:Tricalbin-3 [Smittium mucronatum]|uniref:Tricalbin-3 n=1 Tax=Smittium mucronatum TaxID=133383 RepID=A0A1R0GQ88_9FUNG|nr:Tricalbin-3 [Smittium mucronatum]